VLRVAQAAVGGAVQSGKHVAEAGCLSPWVPTRTFGPHPCLSVAVSAVLDHVCPSLILARLKAGSRMGVDLFRPRRDNWLARHEFDRRSPGSCYPGIVS